MIEDDDTFPDSIKDPRDNLPDLSVKDPLENIENTSPKNIEPRDPSDSLPSVSEAFEKSPRRSVAFLSIVANIKMGVMMIVTAVFLYVFTDYNPRNSIALFVMGLYFLDKARRKYNKFN